MNITALFGKNLTFMEINALLCSQGKGPDPEVGGSPALRPAPCRNERTGRLWEVLQQRQDAEKK